MHRRPGPSTARRASIPALLIPLLLLLPLGLVAQNGTWNAEQVLATKEWALPPAAIAEAVMAPRWLNVSLAERSADGRWFINEVSDGPTGMDLFSKPFDRLGGLFVDFRANRSRALTLRTSAGIEAISAEDGRKVTVQLPAGARVSNATWSPEGAQIAFYVHNQDATHIWVADAATGRARQITRTPVLATAVTNFQWTAGSSKIATVLPPEGRSPRPVPPQVPTGPEVKATEEGENLLRNFASLLATPHDERLLEWHVTGQVALLNVANRAVERVGPPTMIWAFDFSPDGEFVRVTKLEKPFSYVVPVGNFGRSQEIWDRAGRKLQDLDKTPLNTGLRGNVPDAPGVTGTTQETGKRQLAWRRDGKGLTFLEQEAAPDTAGQPAQPPGEGTGQAGPARRKDRVMHWAPPFDSASLKVLYENDARMNTHRYSPDHQWLFLSERQGQNSHEFAVHLSEPGKKHTLARWRTEDFYANPGALVLTGGSVPGGGGGGGGGGGAAGGGGTVQLSGDNSSVFFYGTAWDKDPVANGPRTFLDRVAITTGEKVRAWESSNEGVWERVTAILDVDALSFVVSRESPTQVPQSFRRTGAQLGAQLTQNRDYTPDITNAPKHRFVVERPDGFRFMVNVTLPPGHQGGRLPAMFWFYPREFESQERYDEGQRTFNRNSFQSLGMRSMHHLVRLGYAVVEPDAPIVGRAGQMNNNYTHDLRNNLSAVIDELDRRGIVDRQRLGLGGHSYGAFSTVNAMVQTPFFRAGIAGHGNYNRTLTPLAFQSERRILWDARDVYLGMSPFLFANNLTGALLLYHGLFDQNVGTDPINSPRLFQALNGLNKTAAMYLYPWEDHGPAARETLLDLWARWTAWLEVHLKGTEGAER